MYKPEHNKKNAQDTTARPSELEALLEPHQRAEHQAHDAFFKRSLHKPRLAQQFFQSFCLKVW
jgi:hypothetical protein